MKALALFEHTLKTSLSRSRKSSTWVRRGLGVRVSGIGLRARGLELAGWSGAAADLVEHEEDPLAHRAHLGQRGMGRCREM